MSAFVKIPNPYVWPLIAEVQGSTGGSGGSGFGTLTTLKVANYNAVAGDFVQCDPTAGSFNVNLPAGAAQGAAVTVSNITGSVNSVTVVVPGGQTSFGATTVDVPAYTTITFVYNGAGVWIRA